MSTTGTSGAGPGGARQFGDLLAQIARAKRFYEKSKYGPLVDAWLAAVGEEIAAQTRISAYSQGQLTIDVTSPVLLHELCGFLKSSLLEQLQQTPGAEDIVDLRFRLGRSAAPPGPQRGSKE